MSRPVREYGPRLTMSLCYVSSEDDAGPAKSLANICKATRGWQSAKRCEYPQELGFCFEGVVQLESLRLLVHECKVPSSIHVYVAMPTAEEQKQGACVAFAEANFVSVGHVRFLANEEKAICSRELKSVGVRQHCAYLKLRFNRPKRDGTNLFGQVGLVAVTAHGTLVRPLYYPVMGNISPFVVGENATVPLEEMSPLTIEESDIVNYDAVQVVAAKIEMLKKEKIRAVADEDYDRASTLKSQISALEHAQPQVAKLEDEKRRAVKDEDYPRAKQLRMQINALVNVDSCSGDATPMAPSNHTGQQQDPPHQQQRLSTSQGAATSATEPKPSRSPQKSGPPATAFAQSPAGAARGAAQNDVHEETAVRAKGFYDVDNVANPFGPSGDSGANMNAGEKEIAVNGSGESWERQVNAVIAGLVTDKSVPTTLHGDAAQEGKAFEKDLGVYCTACLLAKRGQLREAAVRGVVSDSGYRALATHTRTAIDTLMSYLASGGHGLGDAVAGVVFASCEALVKLVSGRLTGDHVPSPQQLAGHVAKLSPELVGRLGDANARVRENVEGVISAIARSPIGPDRIIALLLVDPDNAAKKAVSYRAHLGRINLLSAFVDIYGVKRDSSSAHAMDTSQLLRQVVLPCMLHANSEVREAAATLFAKLIMRDAATARPVLTGMKPAQQAVVQEQLQKLPPATGQRQTASRPSSGAGQNPPTPDAKQQQQQPPPPRPRQKNSAVAASPKPDGQSDFNSAPYSTNTDYRTNELVTPLEAIGDGGRELEFRTRHTCQFCGEYNKKFTENELDIHYVRACPMLCPCPLCDQVTEICTLQRHLVTECEGMRLVRECPRCREAVRAEDFKEHTSRRACIEADAAHSVCPLCHARFRAGMDGWRHHLASSPGCPNNPRKYDGSGPVMQ